MTKAHGVSKALGQLAMDVKEFDCVSSFFEISKIS